MTDDTSQEHKGGLFGKLAAKGEAYLEDPENRAKIEGAAEKYIDDPQHRAKIEAEIKDHVPGGEGV